MLIITGRYIPVGRIAVSLTAGATGFSYRRFVPLSIVAGVSWSLYSVGVGVLAGAWFRETPLLAADVAVVVAVVVGLVIDRISSARAAVASAKSVAAREPELLSAATHTTAVHATVEQHLALAHSD